MSDPLSLLASPSGALGGGGQIPSVTLTGTAKSGAALDTSNSSYNLLSGSAGDLIVGGTKNTPWLLLGGAAIVAFFLFRR